MEFKIDAEMGGVEMFTYSCAEQICPGLSANEIQIPHDKHHKVSSLVKKSPKHTQFCQI